MGIVNERVEGSKRPELLSRRSRDDDESTTPGTSHKELPVDLDRWEVGNQQPDSVALHFQGRQLVIYPPLDFGR